MFFKKMVLVILAFSLFTSAEASPQQTLPQSNPNFGNFGGSYQFPFKTTEELVQWLLKGNLDDMRAPKGMTLDQYKLDVLDHLLKFGKDSATSPGARPETDTKESLGTETGNGGDTECEDRFKSVRDDIATWLFKHGADDLKLPEDVSLDRYKSDMIFNILDAHVQCVTTPVYVNGSEKTCRNYLDTSGGKQIVCNFDRFKDTNEDDQYRLVHHEYAGLAGIEVNDKDDSHYFVSNQIAAYLETQRIKKLVIKPQNELIHVSITGAIFIRDTSVPGLREAYRDPSGMIWGSVAKSADSGKVRMLSYNDAVDYCNDVGGRLPTQEEFEQLAVFLGLGSSQGYSVFVVDDDNTMVLPEFTQSAVSCAGSYCDYWTSTAMPSSYDLYTPRGAFGPIDGHIEPFSTTNKFMTRCVSDGITLE